ncbi:replication protein, partial [Aeromonas sp. QDB39]
MADLDDGYTRLANELYDALIESDLSKNEQKVAHAICRCTYGFNKKVDRIADSQIAKRTKLSRQA